MIKYKASNYGYPRITTVEADAETEKTITLLRPSGKAGRVNKQGMHESYFDSWQEAKQWLVQQHEQVVAIARLRLQRANDDLGNVKGLKEPK